jgi:dihydrofolate reductase
MRLVRYCVAMSLDGYIAGPEGEFDWIVVDPDIDFGALFNDFDTILMGRKTYEMTRQHPGPEMPETQTYVFSNTLHQADCVDATASNDPAATVTRLKQAIGKDIWLFGGGVLFNSLLQVGLVDTVEVAVIPILLGSGLPLLPGPATSSKLKLVENRTYDKTGIVSLKYSIV